MSTTRSLRGVVVDLAVDRRRLHGIDPDARDPEVAREIGVLLELGQIRPLVVGIDQVLGPEVRGEARDTEAPAPHLLLQGRALLFVG